MNYAHDDGYYPDGQDAAYLSFLHVLGPHDDLVEDTEFSYDSIGLDDDEDSFDADMITGDIWCACGEFKMDCGCTQFDPDELEMVHDG